MNNQEITTCLRSLFGDAVQVMPPDSWQVEFGRSRLLVLLSEDQSWLRALVAIAPELEVQPFLRDLLVANFDETQETRYAIGQGVLWGVFQHSRGGLTADDFQGAIARLMQLQQQGIETFFQRRVEQQIRQIIQAAKQQGQSLDATLQSLDRLYEEGVMGSMEQSAEQRQTILNAWKVQLQRLWDDPPLS